ncbi:hypothetical protein IMZ48_41595 [Candidatus Bathyarchaeota archaeon]|nr:hypothetical protein [Candidatus Bathyarchaeota archaeon]
MARPLAPPRCCLAPRRRPPSRTPLDKPAHPRHESLIPRLSSAPPLGHPAGHGAPVLVGG